MRMLDALGYEASALALAVVTATALLWLFRKPPLPKNAPPLVTESWPILGSLQHFFTERWDFLQRSSHASKSGNFSFYAGQWPIVALSGEQGRKLFFDEKRLGFTEGYSTLLGGASTVPEDSNDPPGEESSPAAFSSYFTKRLTAVVRPHRLAANLPRILEDARDMFDKLASDPRGQTDPYESIFRMIFKFTMRTVACNEIADDATLLERTMLLLEDLEATASPIAISFPWVPTPAKMRRFYYGARLYKIFDDVVRARHRLGRRDDDPLQYLLDQGDNITDVLKFVLGALFAGQLNSGINTSGVLLHLGLHPTWLDRVREEVESVATQHAPDPRASLIERLMHVPIDAWETGFPTVDLCLRETIRLHTVGAAFRKNTSGQDIPIDGLGGEVIPKDVFVTYALGDAHYSSDIYDDPDGWDPGRYEPERAEDKRRTYGYTGWGVGRHPCLGMRFAKVENNIIVAFFLAYFQNIRVVDRDGRPVDRLPAVDRNRATAHKPTERVYLKYELRPGNAGT